MTTASQDKITVPGDDRLTKLNVSTKTPFWTKIPIIKELRVAVGWQKGMLITGLAITAFFLLVALFAPLIAPYGHAQIKAADGTSFPAQAAPSAEHIWGTTAAGFDVFSRVVWGARTAVIAHRRGRAALHLRRRAARPGLRLLRWLGGPHSGDDRRRRLLLPLAAARHSDGHHDLPRPVRPVERHSGFRHLHHRGVHPAVFPHNSRRSDPHQGIRVCRVRARGRRLHLAHHDQAPVQELHPHVAGRFPT